MSRSHYINNKDSVKARSKKWSIENRERSREIKRKSKDKKKELARQFITSIKTKCSQCSEDFPICLDFHHLSNKQYTISKMVDYGYTIESIKAELEKCILLCANCHRKKHCPKSATYNNTKNKYVNSIKENSKCQNCNENSPAVLGFHHVGEKTLGIGKMIRTKNFTLEDVKTEISKCIILCENCHRKHHYTV